MDEESLEDIDEVYRRYGSFVYNVAYRMLSSKEDAEEVVQNVFLSVYQHRDGFKHQSSIKTWVYRITVNQCLNWIKQNKKHQQGRIDDETVLDHVAVTESSGDDSVSDKVQHMLKVLSEQERSCMILRSIEGLSYEEIAESLAMNINTVRTHLRRAREKLIVWREEGGRDDL